MRKNFTNYFLSIVLIFLCTVSISYAKTVKNNDLENIEVDVVYKYIDLRDPNLKRKNNTVDKYISKDYDNDELKYSLRSVFENIPWIRKIFIIMPNDKVRFLKEPEEIKDKIIYIKNEDVLGVDSDSCEAYEWSFWKLKDYGCSNHILYFCDDYFIGKPMNKSDFFYKDSKNRVLPYIIYNGKLTSRPKKSIEELINKIDNNVGKNDEYAQNGILFRIQNLRTYKFIYDALKKDSLLTPTHLGNLHNVMPFNLDDIKHIHNIVKSEYKYADKCLYGLKRGKYDMWMSTFSPYYYLNKENRKVNKNITYRYFNMSSNKINKNYNLFCINTGCGKYSELERKNARDIMQSLFPKSTKYESV